MFFGQFLIERGVATEEQLLKALDSQKKNRLPIGTVAIMEKFLTIKDVYEILNRQIEAPNKMFGAIAVELDLLTEEELVKILELQVEKNHHVGEILIEDGILDKDRLFEELNLFVRIKEAELARQTSSNK